ncbi:MAG TPA: flagellar biosynthetic protein FliO, partial [Steroidobacteraceae bacterium]|nr:flagellar biosynthetic protein FliO [Steroidobacteraceae bacterium]
MRIVSILVLLCANAAAFAEEQKLFAAPSGAQTAVTSGAGSMAQATLALVLVLAAVFAAAWGLKRLRKFGGAGSAGIEVISQAALGTKERAVLLKVSGAHVLVGVAPGQVNLLHVLAADAVVPTVSEVAQQTPTMAPSFK